MQYDVSADIATREKFLGVTRNSCTKSAPFFAPENFCRLQSLSPKFSVCASAGSARASHVRNEVAKGSASSGARFGCADTLNLSVTPAKFSSLYGAPQFNKDGGSEIFGTKIDRIADRHSAEQVRNTSASFSGSQHQNFAGVPHVVHTLDILGNLANFKKKSRRRRSKKDRRSSGSFCILRGSSQARKNFYNIYDF